MKKSSLKTLCLRGVEVPQCCEVFDCLRSSKINKFQFELKHSTSLPVSVMMTCNIEYYRLHFTLTIHHSKLRTYIPSYIASYGTGQKKLGDFRKGLFVGNPQIFCILLYSHLRFAISASAGIVSDVCKQTNNTYLRRASIRKPCNLRRKLIRTYVEHFDLYLRISIVRINNTKVCRQQ